MVHVSGWSDKWMNGQQVDRRIREGERDGQDGWVVGRTDGHVADGWTQLRRGGIGTRFVVGNKVKVTRRGEWGEPALGMTPVRQRGFAQVQRTSSASGR